MLKKFRSENETAPNPNPVSMEKPFIPAPVAAVSSQEKTVIGQHISVEGIIRGKENLVIEGSMKGSIELEKHQVTVGPNGKVEAEIHADNVIISGRLVGNIKAQGKVEITKEADFSGEIKAKRISVEDGAFLKAVIELERESEKKEIPAPKPAPTGSGTDKTLSSSPFEIKGK